MPMMRTGLDMAVAPSPAHLKAMLDAVGGTWVLPYIGGPRSGGAGWTPQYVQAAGVAGVKEWLPCYVGRQVVPSLGLNDVALLTAGQGYTDGQDAVALMHTYGWGPGCPCALDVESDTAQRATEAAVAYSDGWCKAVRDAGYVPGVYAPLFFLERIWTETNRPSFVYAADWLRGAVDHGLDPAHIPGLPDGVAAGARVWQYAGAISVLGTAVDFDVADIPLARAPGQPPVPVPVPPTPPTPPPGQTPADFAAAAWIAALDAQVSNVPVAQCIARKEQVQAWIATHP